MSCFGLKQTSFFSKRQDLKLWSSSSFWCCQESWAPLESSKCCYLVLSTYFWTNEQDPNKVNSLLTFSNFQEYLLGSTGCTGGYLFQVFKSARILLSFEISFLSTKASLFVFVGLVECLAHSSCFTWFPQCLWAFSSSLCVGWKSSISWWFAIFRSRTICSQGVRGGGSRCFKFSSLQGNSAELGKFFSLRKNKSFLSSWVSLNVWHTPLAAIEFLNIFDPSVRLFGVGWKKFNIVMVRQFHEHDHLRTSRYRGFKLP